MKQLLLLVILLLYFVNLRAQITTPVINANFGVDAELRANFFNNFVQSGNDDWFIMPGTAGIGKHVIDTTGAAAMVARYTVDPPFRQIPFYRTMAYPAYSVINNRLLIDAVFIRDYHGSDSTIFASGSNKNGMSPADWTCPVAQSIPDKNDILDMMVHVRRAGPNSGYDLWMMGGLSIENTTGNRYFDFEMYQTDIYYDRSSRLFYGYGPDAGHTSWGFDAAGNITRPGDIIFTAEYSSSSLTKIEARIWIDKASMSLSPAAFTWTGSFDGATNGSQYGYAGIVPSTTGSFYTGMASPNNTWAGPFALIRDNNSMVTNYIAGQYMEFSVNLTKLGLDPVTLLGGDCGMPFRRVLVKSRASTSFTAELKDFVGPFDFFLAPRAETMADVPMYCGAISSSEIQVTNPVSTSVYNWYTPDGNIVGSTTGTSISVDAPGTYIVTQQLQSGCSEYARDTTVITYDPYCTVLSGKDVVLKAYRKESAFHISWMIQNNNAYSNFALETSYDGNTFSNLHEAEIIFDPGNSNTYYFTDSRSHKNTPYVYYRIKLVDNKGMLFYSKTIRHAITGTSESAFKILTNPVQQNLKIAIGSAVIGTVTLNIINAGGKLVRTFSNEATGPGIITVGEMNQLPDGVYTVQIISAAGNFFEKIVIKK